jgi:hypothetical protein
LIKASFLVVSPVGKTQLQKKLIRQVLPYFFIIFFSYNSAGDQLQTELPQKK